MMTFRNSKLGRRELLKAAGASTALLPFVPILESRAQAEQPPKRFICFYSSNGIVREAWTPKMNGSELELSPILAPLEPYKSRLLAVDGLRYKVVEEKGAQGGHHGGFVTALTGRRYVIPAGAGKDDGLADGISIDQHIANTISQGLKFRSLELGIQVDTFSVTLNALSYRGPLQPQSPENDPYKVFERVFGGSNPKAGAAPDPARAVRLRDRRSVLDFAVKDLARIRQRLGTREQLKLDAHLENLRAIESTLETGQGASAVAACEVPNTGARLDVFANDNIPAVGRLQMDLLVMAMACDLTRVGTIQYGRAGANHRFTWLGGNLATDANISGDGTSGIHGLAHNEGNAAARADLVQCHRWYAGEIAYLMGKLAAIPEGDGSMLDNTLIVSMNEMGTGNHGLSNTPWLIAGNAGGFFRTGRVIHAQDQPHNRLLVAFAQAMELPDSQFGDPDYGEVLPDLS
jgi:hypothetical protein